MKLDFLQDLLVSTNHFERVDYASQMDFVGHSDESKTLPAAFFHLFKETARPNETIGLSRQEVTILVAIKVVAKNSQLHHSRDVLRGLLLGYAPTLEQSGVEVISPFQYVGGEVVDVDRSVIWWRDIYELTVLKTGEV